jgi:hypothetical protein
MDKDHPQWFPAKTKIDPEPVPNPRPGFDVETNVGWNPVSSSPIRISDGGYFNMGSETEIGESIVGRLTDGGDSYMLVEDGVYWAYEV